jgi:hypothetical protein
LRQGRAVRLFFLLLGLTISAGLARAQDQENKLVDRLLRPDMTLTNQAQNKKFTGTGGTPVDKKFVAKSFYAGDERTTKRFAGEKDFSAKGFATKKFTRAERAANTKTNAGMANANAEFATRKSSLIRTASDEGKVAKTRDYADSRPFLVKGTRQKILSQEDKPLTIDEIRELLNKSK